MADFSTDHGLPYEGDFNGLGLGGAAAAFSARQPEAARSAAISETVETEIIPRLLLLYRQGQRSERGTTSAGAAPSAQEVIEFTDLILASDVSDACAFVDALEGRGVSRELIYLRLFTPAAHRLGEMWEEDSVFFSDVAIAVGRLHQLLRRFGADSASNPPRERRILIAGAPREKHIFGSLMVGEFFRHAGWNVSVLPLGASQQEVVRLAQTEHWDVIGFSISCIDLVDDLSACIAAARAASRNRNLVVMVGGSLFNGTPELFSRVGADATATDGAEAVRLVERLVVDPVSLNA